MVLSTATAAPNIGFLTVLHDASGYLGGYLVTNVWGRPLEFRLSTAVQPNRVQQILYGGTLRPYICADLIGKTLVEKTSAAVQLLITDSEPVLEVRSRLEIPAAWLPGSESETPSGGDSPEVAASPCRRVADSPLLCHPHFLSDAASIRQILDRLDGFVDLAEPFARIREAIAEARKFGVTNRAG